MDRSVSDQHGGHERDGILLSVPRRYPCDRRWNYLAGPSGGRDRRPIRPSPCGTLALDLCGVRDDCTLLECLRTSRATLSEGASAENFGPHAVRAAIRGHATGRARTVCLANHYRRNQISPRTTKQCLILLFNSNDIPQGAAKSLPIRRNQTRRVQSSLAETFERSRRFHERPGIQCLTSQA